MKKIILIIGIILLAVFIVLAFLWGTLKPTDNGDIEEAREKALQEEVVEKTVVETVKKPPAKPKSYWEKVYTLEEEIDKLQVRLRKGELSQVSYNEKEARLINNY